MRRAFHAFAFAVAVLAAGMAGVAQVPEPQPDIPGLEGLPPSSQQLFRIRVHMAEILEHQPDYTCLETVERSYRAPSARNMQYDDTLRLEVALVDGKEMFAWPGSKKFEETDLRKLVPTGTFGNGNFALHARSVFLGHAATFTYRGAEIYVGSKGALERYDFRVPRVLSGYNIRVLDRSGIAGYHGSFWADKESLDVSRLEIIAEDIPPDLGVTAASDRMDYARLLIGSGQFLLPAESELDMTDSYGIESRNQVRFTNCRQYTGESTLTFDDIDPTPSDAPPAELPEMDLPADLSFAVALEEALDLDTAAVGDPVRGRLNAALRRKGQVLAAKGAMVDGRVTRLERHDSYIVLGITLSGLESATARWRVNAKLDNVAGIQFLTPPRNVRIQPGPPQAGEGLIVLRSGRVRLARGILMYWTT